MPLRPSGTPPRDILEVDWTFFGELCRGLALRVAMQFDQEIVVGIAKAGVIHRHLDHRGHLDSRVLRRA